MTPAGTTEISLGSVIVFSGLLCLLGAVSIIPSARGHWLGHVLATPPLAWGFLTTAIVIWNDVVWRQTEPPSLLSLAPLAIGAFSMGLCVARYRKRRTR